MFSRKLKVKVKESNGVPDQIGLTIEDTTAYCCSNATGNHKKEEIVDKLIERLKKKNIYPVCVVVGDKHTKFRGEYKMELVYGDFFIYSTFYIRSKN